MISGLFLFWAEAAKNYLNPAFRVKMILLLLVGLNPVIFRAGVYRRVSEWELQHRSPWRACCRHYINFSVVWRHHRWPRHRVFSELDRRRILFGITASCVRRSRQLIFRLSVCAIGYFAVRNEYECRSAPSNANARRALNTVPTLYLKECHLFVQER